jgi:hypothetical protein
MVELPPPTTTLGGTVAAALLLCNAIVAPLDGAAVDNVTVPVTVPPPTTELAESVTDVSVGDGFVLEPHCQARRLTIAVINTATPEG